MTAPADRRPTELAVHRLKRRIDAMAPEERERFAAGLDTLHTLMVDRNVRMSIRDAISAGLLSEAETYGAFGLAVPTRSTRRTGAHDEAGD